MQKVELESAFVWPDSLDEGNFLAMRQERGATAEQLVEDLDVLRKPGTWPSDVLAVAARVLREVHHGIIGELGSSGDRLAGKVWLAVNLIEGAQAAVGGWEVEERRR